VDVFIYSGKKKGTEYMNGYTFVAQARKIKEKCVILPGSSPLHTIR